MDQDFFTSLPTVIMFDIILRLPTRSIMSCKCVCKSWRDLIKTPEFVDSHSSRSVPCLAFLDKTVISEPIKIIEFVDSQNSWQNQCNVGLNINFPHRKINFPHRTTINGSANGLLCLSTYGGSFSICNPITREYIKLPLPAVVPTLNHVYGFGVSKLSGEFKVVRLFSARQIHQLNLPCKCEVYTLVEGLWRSVETTGGQLKYARWTSSAVFSNGTLHWLVAPYKTHLERILCFDLETECFRNFSVPHLDLDHRSMCALGDSLCLCDYCSSGDDFEIWLMKKYGDDKSWTREFVIKTQGPKNDLHEGVIEPIKVFEGGDILFVGQHFSFKFYYYSSKSKTLRASAAEFLSRPCIYKPSFIPLKTFTMENDVIKHW